MRGRSRAATAARRSLPTDPHRRFENPSPRYLVHLDAPGWNVAGATSPWLPGVAIGHNDRVAWGMTASNADTQDIYVGKLNPANPHQVFERGRWVDLVVGQGVHCGEGPRRAVPLRVRIHAARPGGRDRPRKAPRVPAAMERCRAGRGPRARARSRSIARGPRPSFATALARWKMPPAEFVYADVDGGIGRQVAALTPIRGAWGGVRAGAGRERSVRVARMDRRSTLAAASRIRRQASSRRRTAARRGPAGSARCWRIRRRAGSKDFNAFSRTCSPGTPNASSRC